MELIKLTQSKRKELLAIEQEIKDYYKTQPEKDRARAAQTLSLVGKEKTPELHLGQLKWYLWLYKNVLKADAPYWLSHLIRLNTNRENNKDYF